MQQVIVYSSNEALVYGRKKLIFVTFTPTVSTAQHWGIPLSRRFRALKLWFVLRIYGANGIREYIRRHVKLAQQFTEYIQSDDRFELIGKPIMGLVCFRLKGSNTLNQYLTRALNESLELHVVPAVVKDVYFIRFCVCREACAPADITHAWEVISLISGEILRAQDALDQWRHYVLGKTGTDPAKAGLDELNTGSSVSDEEDDQYWERALHHGQASEDLMRLVKKRLYELQELGATDAYNLLLSYLQNSGWCLDELVPDDLIIKADASAPVVDVEASVRNVQLNDEENEARLSDMEDSGKYSLHNGYDHSPERQNMVKEGNSLQEENEKSLTKKRGEDETNQCSSSNASPGIRIRGRVPIQNSLKGFVHYSHLIEPEDEFFLPSDLSIHEDTCPRSLLTDEQTSSPIVERNRAFPCYAASNKADQIVQRDHVTHRRLSCQNNASSEKNIPNEIRPHFEMYQARELNSTAPLSQTNSSIGNRANSSTLSKSFDHSTTIGSFMRRPIFPSHPGPNREAYVCERDLAVGSVHDRTLEKVQRSVLRKMISEPTSNSSRFAAFEESKRNRELRPHIRCFLDEILTPAQLVLNKSISSKPDIRQSVVKSESIIEKDGDAVSTNPGNVKPKRDGRESISSTLESKCDPIVSAQSPGLSAEDTDDQKLLQ
ncbi:unnamed protein product [Echinostoma caproni]|uniref:Protein kinase domain-containing protein n=1 Tax=Echinostoma caproni TaxID=27848 RepID=A0A183ATK9_9TREM|nr:unnamed protein product [Echinostoma caproni]